jgi:RNA recognition motif-containing protein
MGKKLYVGNLSYSVTSSDLEQMFSAHGLAGRSRSGDFRPQRPGA